MENVITRWMGSIEGSWSLDRISDLFSRSKVSYKFGTRSKVCFGTRSKVSNNFGNRSKVF